ncbi:hypothetical protein GCM10009525_39030 [Streptosporangium amethystogenes subsp. fukuiense]
MIHAVAAAWTGGAAGKIPPIPPVLRGQSGRTQQGENRPGMITASMLDSTVDLVCHIVAILVSRTAAARA